MKFDIRQVETTTSTNDDAKRAADEGAPEGTVIWALSQTAGRGRQGRTWHSPHGNLYASILMRPKHAMRDYGHYSFIAALAISDAVSNILKHALVEHKWPNDVLVAGKKISGILLETGEGWLVIGMGINVEHTPQTASYPVTSLGAERADLPLLKTVLDHVLEALHRWSCVMDNQGFSPIREAWLQRARKGGMHVRLPEGEIYGEFADLDEQGNLLLSLKDGTKRSINTGDVFF